MKKFVAVLVWHCLLPLIIGAAVYLFFRKDFFPAVSKITTTKVWLKQLLFTLPDFCWSYSLACALFLFSIFHDLNFRKTAVFIFIILIVSELVQIFLPQYFTFDMFDLAATVLTFVLSTFVMKKLAYEKEF